MDQLQWILSVVLRLLRERLPTLFGDDAGVADLLCVLDDGEAARHGVLAELVQRFEVEVATHRRVEVGEQLATAGQMVGGAAVEVPAVEHVFAAIVEERACSGLVDVDVDLGAKAIAICIQLEEPWALKRAASPSSTCATCVAPPRSRRGSG